MAFTYDLASLDPAIVTLSRVRIELGDHIANAGVLPDGCNIQDEVINLYLAEHDGDIAATVGAMAGILARHWSTAADVSVGPRRESLSQVSEKWAKQSSGGADGLSSMRGFFGVVSRGLRHP
jgi:hypothetical protein